jgi:phosphoglycolate phosphatase-like HAD superfamily hydrolase
LQPAMNLRGILFDVDGTLVDSNDIHTECWIEAFAHFGKKLKWSEVRHQIGKGGDLLVPDLLNAKEMQAFGEKVKKYRADLFKRKYMKQILPFPRMRECLRELRERKIRLALASSSNPDEVEYYTQLLGVGELLAGTTSKKDAKFSKPSPEIFEAARQRTKTSHERTLIVGDTPYDILAAHRSAMAIAAVLCGGFERKLLKKAEFLFADVEELLEKIEKVDEYFEK